MGKKSRRKREAKQTKTVPNIFPIQPNQTQSVPIYTPSQVFRRNVCPASLFVSATLFGYGGGEMSSGSLLAPWLMAFGALMVAIAILINQDVGNVITKYVPTFWKRALIGFVVCGLFFAPVLLVFQNVANDQREELSKMPIFYGELTPGNEPSPPSPSYNLFGHTIPSEPPDSFRVMFGDDSGIFIDGPVNNTFCLKDKPFMTIRTAADGTVVLNTEVLDSTNHKIVKIIDNEFQANPNYAFRPKQPDKHSLVVRDSDGVKVLNIRYINPKTIWISGRFFLPGDSRPVTIFPSGLIEFGELSMKNIYVTGNFAGERLSLGY